MALYPGAKINLIPIVEGRTKPTPLDRHDGYVAHTIVGSAASCISMFKNNGYGGSNSHWVMDFGGNVTQLVDTKHRANCQVEGNWRLLSCEHADFGEGFPWWDTDDAGQVPAFTSLQVDAEIELQLWCIKTYGFSARLMGSSKGEQGIGWHKLGCDPYRVSGGEKWSSSYGKVCPGSRRIDQLQHVIFPEVQRRLAGAPAPTPAPPAKEIDPMALSRLMQAAGPDGGGGGAIYVVNESMTQKRHVTSRDRLNDELTLNKEHKFLVSDQVRVVSPEYLAQIPLSGTPDPT